MSYKNYKITLNYIYQKIIDYIDYINKEIIKKINTYKNIHNNITK